MSGSTKVLIIDDHAVVREGIKVGIERAGIERAGIERKVGFITYQAASKAEAMAQLAKVNPDAIIVDINLPDGSGLEIVSWARSVSQRIAIVVLTLNESDEFVLAAMKAGASSFLNKSAPLNELLAALEHALESPLTFSSREVALSIARRSDRFGLSQRELQVLTQLHKGASAKELASSLFITEATLKTHLATIYRKLSVSNRVQAIEKARLAGIT